jgi:hypothetical protein
MSPRWCESRVATRDEFELELSGSNRAEL